MYIAVQTAIFIIGRPKVRASFFGIRGAQFRAPLNSSAQYYRDIRSVSGGGRLHWVTHDAEMHQPFRRLIVV